MGGARLAILGLLAVSACHGVPPTVIEDGRAIAAALCVCLDRPTGTPDAQVETCLTAQASRWNAIETAVRATESDDGPAVLAAWDRCLWKANAFYDAEAAKRKAAEAVDPPQLDR